MTSYKDARKEINEIFSRAKLREEEEKIKKEKERRERIEAEKEKKIRNERILKGIEVIKSSANELLLELNNEVIDGKGQVYSWKNYKISEHPHYVTYDAWESDDIGHLSVETTYHDYDHRCVMSEAGLEISNIGKVFLYYPIKNEIREPKSDKWVISLPLYVRITYLVKWKNDLLCDEGKSVDLTFEKEELIKKVKEALSNQIVSLFREGT